MAKTQGRLSLLLIPILATALPAFAADSAEQVEIAAIDATSRNYLVFAISVTLVKITALVIGFLVVRLGYTTMMAGVHGKDSIELGLWGARFGFKGVTPGLALGVVGVLLMMWAVSTKSQFSAEASARVTTTTSSTGSASAGGKTSDEQDSSTQSKEKSEKEKVNGI